MICNSLKEAIDITLKKYNQPKSEGNYKKILNFIVQGQYRYITSDDGARKYVIQCNLLDEIDKLYEQHMLGNEWLLDNLDVSLEEKISGIANHFSNLSKEENKIGFGVLAGKIDRLNVKNKTEHLYNLILDNVQEMGLTSGDVKRLVVENAYRLSRLHKTRSGNSIFNLYSDGNYPISERENLSKQIGGYLFDIFEDISAEQLVNFINALDQEQIYYMCNLYGVTRRNYANSNYINRADTIDATRETLDIFAAFSDSNLPKQISNTGISY